MRGSTRTRPGLSLAHIFFNIRTTRDKATRKSWQRRARLALAKLDGFSDAEKHEIAAVWSRPDCDRYDSPALRRLLKLEKQEHQTKPAKSATRKAYRSKTAANDAIFWPAVQIQLLPPQEPPATTRRA